MSNISNKHVILTDFLLSKRAQLCTEQTIDWYERMLAPFISNYQFNSKDIRFFLASIAKRNVSSSTVHAHARALRAFMNFCYEEEYINKPIKVPMPKVHRKRMEVLSEAGLKQIVKVCSVRDKSLILLLIDSGIRRGEAIALNWEDIDIKSGQIIIQRGKGSRARVTYIGAKTRRALLKWKSQSPRNPIYPLTKRGASSIMDRLSRKTGVKITFHMCRRSFATFALRNGMDLFSLQRLLGHSTLEMTRIYAQQVDSDLQVAHKYNGPVDRLF
jgi:integrase